jgi:hypothetical protein
MVVTVADSKDVVVFVVAATDAIAVSFCSAVRRGGDRHTGSGHGSRQACDVER